MHPVLLLPAVVLGFLAARVWPRRQEPQSPIFGVALVDWTRFVAVMAVHPKNRADERGKLGTFGMDARRLRDVGVMRTAEKGVRDGVAGVWVGTWEPPLTEAAFLGSMPLQYAAFVRSMRAAAPKVSQHVGTVVEEKEATLSGLLGVTHAAGEAGTASWVADPEIRRRFARTTEAFHRTNGIF